MSYVVFARKWRPKDFKEVIGQEHITTTLRNAISNNRVAHAYIFTGPRGIGKTSVARILAKGLNCEKGPTASPCNKCASCNSITSGTSMDVIEIDGASNNSVDQVRELRENIKFMPSYGRYKLYIIDEVHMLSIGEFNALLKTLEEPPKHARFVFATTNPEKVPPTILSRCQRFDFGRISLKLIISKLKRIAETERLNISEDAIFSIARAAEGSMRDAESILDQLTSFCEKKIDGADVIALLGIIKEDKLADVVEKLSKRDTAGLLKAIDELIIAGKDITQFLKGLMGYLRNLMVLKVSSGLSSLVDLPDNHIARLKEQLKNFEIDELLYMFYTIQTTANAIKRSEVSRFLVEASLIKLSLRGEVMPLSEIMDKIASLEANIGKNSNFRSEPERAEEKPQAVEEPLGNASKEIESIKDEATVNPHTAGTPTPEKVKETWPKILQVIKNQKISIASYLLEGEVMKVDSSAITLGFYKKFNFHKEALERANNKKFIEKIASDAFGYKVKIEFVILEDSEASLTQSGSTSKVNAAEEELERESKKEAFDEPLIQSAIEMFKGKIVKNE
jgi:DNA polymerase-3 subunit gamma/tau